MKKYVLHLAGLAAAAVIAAHAGPALALTAAHQASATGATQGDCSICHVAHKAAGSQRLFPNAPTGASLATYGYMGSMCAEYCHVQLGGLPRAYAAESVFMNIGSATLSDAAHGLNLLTTAMPPNTVVPATLPYGNDGRGLNSQGTVGSFECTTCHDPHKNATGDNSHALLRLDIDALCDECHTARGAGDGAWGAAYGDANALGSHPVGTDVLDDSDTPANSNIYIGGVAPTAGQTSFDTPYATGGASGAHNLGGHLLNGLPYNNAAAGVTCASCHAVHGYQPDNGDAAPVAAAIYEDLLVVPQGVMGTTEPNRSANGAGNASNALCAGCHAYTGVDDWNPGASAFGHPANGQVAQADMGTITDPSGGTWPYGSNAVANFLDLGIICESCHKPHAATVNSHILRADELALCGMCHTSAPANHHPAGVPMGAMADAAIDLGVVGTLECSDCHSGNGAHNWAAAGAVGLSPAWEPTDNARDAASDGVGIFSAKPLSKECIDCHTAGGTRNTPTLHNNNTAGTLTYRGEGSHYIGDTDNTGNGNLANGTLNGDPATAANGQFNAFTTVWPNGRTSPGWSRLGGVDATNYVLVCEGCHELEPDKNAAGSALLLYAYTDREDAPTSKLCTGCHGIVPGGSSVHPLTLSTISKRVDTPTDTTKTLVNDPGNGYADASGAPNLAEYPGGVTTNNRMNCDSCHQPHDAPTDSGSFILEYNDGVGTGLGTSVVSGVTLANHDADTGQGIEHNTLCVQCHNY